MFFGSREEEFVRRFYLYWVFIWLGEWGRYGGWGGERINVLGERRNVVGDKVGNRL